MPIRLSNMELLRIVSMLMVLAVHLDGASIGLPKPAGEITGMSARDWYRLSVESVTIVGVNCFVLISGYFGINARWKSFLRLTATCLFYSVGIYLVMAATGNITWSWAKFGESFLVYTHNDLWFISAYLLLFILSPLLNAASGSMPKNRFTGTLLAFLIFTLYAGWGWHESFNQNGYTAMQLILVYLIGRYIRLYIPQGIPSRMKCLAFYAVFTILILVQSLFCPNIWAFAYNSPFVLGASVSLFLLFRTFSFHNRTVNIFAASAFSVYLIHKNPLVWIHLKQWTSDMWQSLSLGQFALIATAAVLAIYAACTIVDRIRILLTSKI